MKTATKQGAKRNIITVLAAVAIVCGMAAPTVAQELTALPTPPLVGGLDLTEVQVLSSTNFLVTYDLDNSVNPWEGAWILLPDPVDFSSTTQFVFGISGDPETITVEFKDNIGGVTVIGSPTITSDFQFWLIDAADVNNTDLSQLKELVFVVHGWSHGGVPAGDYTVHIAGLNYTANVNGSDPSGSDLSELPGLPPLASIDGTTYTQHSSSNFTMIYDISGVYEWRAVAASWGGANPADLSGFSEFVIGVSGDPNAIKVEFKDANGGVSIVNLNGLDDTLQHWVIPASEIQNSSLTNVAEIVFVVDQDLAGAANYVGEFDVFIHGLRYTGNVDGSDAGESELTVLPDLPTVASVDGALFEQHSSSSFTVEYDISDVYEWRAVAVAYGAENPGDLSGYTQFVFGVTGDPNSIKVEFKDNSGGVSIVNLHDVGPGLQHWVIPVSAIQHTDMTDVESIVFVVDRGLAGAPNYAGFFTVHVGGLRYTANVDWSDWTESEITELPDLPTLASVDGTMFDQHSSSNFTLTYDISDEFEWRATAASWTIEEPGDLSSYTQFVFGVVGDPNAIKVEFKDTLGNVSVVNLHGVDDELRHWVIPASAIQHTDMNNVQEIVFVVDRNLAGAANYVGEFTVYVGGLRYTGNVDASDSSGSEITQLPDTPIVTDVDGSTFQQHSLSNFTLMYDISDAYEWRAVAVAYGTENPGDLSGYTQFVFGVLGDPESIKVEFKDTSGGVSVVNLHGVSGALQHWVIPASEIQHTDLSDVEAIVFVVDRGLAGAANYVGEFTVYVGGLDGQPPAIDLDATDPSVADITVLPFNPLLNDLNGTLFIQHSTTNFTLWYDLDLAPGGWSGVMVRWEDFNPVDLTAITQFVFGVRGSMDAIKVEFEDSNNGKTVFNLNGVTDELQHWHIDASLIANLDDIEVINFVVDGGLAGEGNDVGFFTVFVGGLVFEQAAAAIGANSPEDMPITILPGLPVIDELVGTAFTQHSSTNFTVHYDLNVSAEEWEGVMVHWASFALTDLTSIDTFVIGVTGSVESIKVEFVHSSGIRTIFFLDGVTDELQHWHIPAALISHLDEIEVIAFVVDPGLAGTGNEVGQFTVFLGGLFFENGGITDGIPNWWWDAHSVAVENRVAANYPPGHPDSYLRNYIADTDPNDPDDSFTNEITIGGVNGDEWTLLSGEPTSADRLYDVLFTDDLMADPVVWVPLDLDLPGEVDLSPVSFTVTNNLGRAFFRSSVRVPTP